jgi:hypothetical protein
VKNWQFLLLLVAVGFAAPRRWKRAAVAVVLVVVALVGL